MSEIQQLKPKDCHFLFRVLEVLPTSVKRCPANLRKPDLGTSVVRHDPGMRADLD